jgi:protoporphyrinogen oxidase
MSLSGFKKGDRVVIIGGGYAGLTVAKNIRLHNKKAQVIVFEPKNIFASCPGAGW